VVDGKEDVYYVVGFDPGSCSYGYLCQVPGELASRTFGALKKKDVVSWNMIIAGCAEVGELEQAWMFFDQMPCRDIVSWNSLITGYACRGGFSMVKDLIIDLVMENVIPDTVSMISLVSAAAETGALDQGRWAHG